MVDTIHKIELPSLIVPSLGSFDTQNSEKMLDNFWHDTHL